MNKIIRKVVRVSIGDGKLEQFIYVSNLFINRVIETEPNTHIYDWYINKDKNTCTIIEQYQDSDALLFHLSNIKDLYEPLFEVAQIVHIEVLGTPSEEVIKAHLPQTQFLTHLAGISR